ncbi:MAG: hypothetical protein RIT26_564 [Pseudomonadota bacterium]
MPGDHSEVVPLLPIPNRTVKRFSADDSADARVKVGHRQALTAWKGPSRMRRAFSFVCRQKATINWGLTPIIFCQASSIDPFAPFPVGRARLHQLIHAAQYPLMQVLTLKMVMM